MAQFTTMRGPRVLWALLCIAIGGWAMTAGAQQVPDYILNPGDQLEISVWKEPDLTRTVVVRPDGKFTFPLTGEVVARGRTAADVQTEVTKRLLKYIPEPVVTVSVVGMQGNQVYVIGQVNKPGAFVMNPQISVLQALSIAGGMTPYAALNDIIVVRGTGANRKTMQVRYSDISKGRSLEQNILLESGDVVIVP